MKGTEFLQIYNYLCNDERGQQETLYRSIRNIGWSYTRVQMLVYIYCLI
jgi:hypothetical protein